MNTSELPPDDAMETFQKRWLLENNVQTVDTIFKHDEEEEQSLREIKPWLKDEHYFKDVKLSVLALLKMVIHAQSGGNKEIMGLLQGYIKTNTFIIMDSFALPVEGSETRVNAQAEAYEYMINYSENCKSVGRMENIVGWYHSHPSYGCYLSGIDVGTQSLNQQFQDPFLALVIDPIRTVTAGKVDIGAFRTYPENYKPQEYQSILSQKVKDFGFHCKKYYSLDISYFKSSLDSAILSVMWATYWKSILTSSPLRTNSDYLTSQVIDLAEKLERVRNKDSDLFSKCLFKTVKDSQKLGCAVVQSLISEHIRHSIFNFNRLGTK